jgi:hypothetical protein
VFKKVHKKLKNKSQNMKGEGGVTEGRRRSY